VTHGGIKPDRPEWGTAAPFPTATTHEPYCNKRHEG
jgi:hypothetical protein